MTKIWLDRTDVDATWLAKDVSDRGCFNWVAYRGSSSMTL